MTSQVQDVILPRSHHVTLFRPVSDQRRPLASDPLHISDPGSKPTPHRGRVQPPDNRAWRAPSPRGWTSVFLIGPCRGWRGYAFKRCDCVEDGEQGAGDKYFSSNRTPTPTKQFSTIYAWTADRWGHHRERGGPMENEEIKCCVLASLWEKNKLRFQRLVCTTRSEGPIWTKKYERYVVSDHVVS